MKKNPAAPMTVTRQPDGSVLLASSSTLSLHLNANGAMRSFMHGELMLNLFPGGEIEGGPFNIYLRQHRGGAWASTPLLGPLSPSSLHFGPDAVIFSGQWGDVAYTLRPVLAASEPAWFWHVELQSTGSSASTVDLLLAQDLALSNYGAVRLNEYYVSQYVDHSALQHPSLGWVVASRQNQAVEGRHPWCVQASLRRAVSYGTDALQLMGLAQRGNRPWPGLAGGLPGTRLQHEHGMALLQDAPLHLPAGGRAQRGFFGWLCADHDAATSEEDLRHVDRVMALPEAQAAAAPLPAARAKPAASLFSSAPLLTALPLGEAELRALLPGGWREAERDEAGTLLSLFTGARSHIVLPAKELTVLRPHGHILRTGQALVPDEAALTSTLWMAGVFHSMLTQGHVSYNRFLSTTHAYLGLFRSQGLRAFVEIDGAWQLLDQPSAFEMRPEGCRWWYRHAQGLIVVEATAATDQHRLTLSLRAADGPPLRCLLSLHVALDGDDGANTGPVNFASQGDRTVRVTPSIGSEMHRRFGEAGFTLQLQGDAGFAQVGGDELLFADGRSQRQPFLCCITEPVEAVMLHLSADLVASESQPDEDHWPAMSAELQLQTPGETKQAGDIARLTELTPWLAHNALIHYLSPRGLEQYSGGGWGTRDVTQGPVEMMLALGRHAPVRDLLLHTFVAQNEDGDWPQWFMFFPRERHVRAGDSHGDIVFWPLLALGQYLLASGDADLLDEILPFYAPPDTVGTQATLHEHLARALAVIASRRIAGTRLAAYGHGDWNDSLQPADPAMRERLCSAWTVTLHHQTLSTLAEAYERLGRLPLAQVWRAEATAVLADFQRLLVVDEVLAGFAYFDASGRIDYLLHPRDAHTGLHYSVLAMVHAIINEMFTPAQAQQHLALISEHLLGPDGVRLFDRAMAYQGGPMRFFQRAESASFFGREIGQMYTHAHLRYAECLWRLGESEAFFAALCKINPIGLRQHVPTSTRRQANCYYSSSDAAFADRYEAHEHYDRIALGEVALEGGWRIYSSGPGIALGLVLRCLLGLRWEHQQLVIDPVLPPSLDGLRAQLLLAGHRFDVVYSVAGTGAGPSALTLNGAPLAFSRGANAYRTGAARVDMALLQTRLRPDVNELVIQIGEP